MLMDKANVADRVSGSIFGGTMSLLSMALFWFLCFYFTKFFGNVMTSIGYFSFILCPLTVPVSLAFGAILGWFRLSVLFQTRNSRIIANFFCSLILISSMLLLLRFYANYFVFWD